MKKLCLVLLCLLAFSARAQLQTINVGTSPNDHLGDPLRTAFSKCNANFTYLMSRINTTTNYVYVTNYVTATNLVYTLGGLLFFQDGGGNLIGSNTVTGSYSLMDTNFNVYRSSTFGSMRYSNGSIFLSGFVVTNTLP